MLGVIKPFLAVDVNEIDNRRHVGQLGLVKILRHTRTENNNGVEWGLFVPLADGSFESMRTKQSFRGSPARAERPRRAEPTRLWSQSGCRHTTAEALERLHGFSRGSCLGRERQGDFGPLGKKLKEMKRSYPVAPIWWIRDPVNKVEDVGAWIHYDIL